MKSTHLENVKIEFEKNRKNEQIISIEQLPFDFAKTAESNNIMMMDDNDIPSDDLVAANRATSMMKPTSTPPPKLPLQRKQSLTHINRRRRSIGARCA